ncbi:hypothetical protein AB4Y63_06120 [Leifsonia sp. YAF41]|uniref:hypothetical protein n=1 Tax=Leifsonia sp. YAF41 TaxID=3233086 RepID=UPI003F9CA669
MKLFLLDSNPAVTDADPDVPDDIETVAPDERPAHHNDDSKYRAWEFDDADRAMVEDLSY